MKTADIIRKAQPLVEDENGNRFEPVVEQVRNLMEQDFGYYEGRSYLIRETYREIHKGGPGFVDMESKESMVLRVDSFLDHRLLPIMARDAPRNAIVAVVSHGIILSVLWRRLLQRFPPKSVALHPEVLATHGQIDLERLRGWSNTGYLELDIQRQIPQPMPLPSKPSTILPTQQQQSAPPTNRSMTSNGIALDINPGSNTSSIPTEGMSLIGETTSSIHSTMAASTQALVGWTMTICAINSQKHLAGLKRTGGGVGSARHDEKQKNMDSFFKRKRTG